MWSTGSLTHFYVGEHFANVLKLVGGLLESQVGIVEVEDLNVAHVELRHVCRKLDQQLQLHAITTTGKILFYT